MPASAVALHTATAKLPILDLVFAKRDLILRIAKMDHIEGVSVFGSVARREEQASSDIDFLVDPADDASLFDIAQFELDMEALFDRSVDAVSSRALSAEKHADILREVVAL
ncbi:MAG: hypothetical protein LBU38_03945 [Propionibacteriaceae bacterium]|jgi:predicted nucleotidyltransferase|nr:hypothetical protein [Propionibacteriaceae bacterium]